MLAILLCLLPGDSINRDRCELAEFNVVASGHGVSVAQLILWDGVELDDGFAFRVRDWRGFRAARGPDGQVSVDWPSVRPCGSGVLLRWFDRQDGVWREVRAQSVRYSLTPTDPELADRNYLPADQRAKLSRGACTESSRE